MPISWNDWNVPTKLINPSIFDFEESDLFCTPVPCPNQQSLAPQGSNQFGFLGGKKPFLKPMSESFEDLLLEFMFCFGKGQELICSHLRENSHLTLTDLSLGESRTVPIARISACLTALATRGIRSFQGLAVGW